MILPYSVFMCFTVLCGRTSDHLTENGIEESGTHDELMKLGGVYAQLYKWTK